MKKQQAIDYFGSAANMANALGLTKGAVSQWGDYIPKGRAFEIQAITGGKLKYEPKPDRFKKAG